MHHAYVLMIDATLLRKHVALNYTLWVAQNVIDKPIWFNYLGLDTHDGLLPSLDLAVCLIDTIFGTKSLVENNDNDNIFQGIMLLMRLSNWKPRIVMSHTWRRVPLWNTNPKECATVKIRQRIYEIYSCLDIADPEDASTERSANCGITMYCSRQAQFFKTSRF